MIIIEETDNRIQEKCINLLFLRYIHYINQVLCITLILVQCVN